MAEFPYLRVANVQAGHVDLKHLKKIRLPLSEASRSMLQEGDVLMTEGGDPDKLGRGCVWNNDIKHCLHQNHVFAVRPDASLLQPRFLGALLESQYARDYFLLTSKQTTNLASTNRTTIGQFRVLLPGLREQHAILLGLDAEMNPLIAALSRAEREIALLREYRTRLVADVVTGQLDVREAARNLPEEEPLREAEEADEDLLDEADLEGDSEEEDP